MNIIGVESLIYGSEDVDAGIRFFQDWGIPLSERNGRGAVFTLPDGTTVVIRPIDDADLPPPAVPGPTVRETIWGVDSRRTLDAVKAALSKDREVTQTSDGVLHAADNHGYRIGFCVSARVAHTLHLPATNTVGAVQRRDQRAEGVVTRRARPERIGHVVFWAPGDLDHAARFYMERLGFKLTDAVKGLGMFLRCGASHDHHNLFLQQRGEFAGFQHVSFEVADFDEVMMCGNHMEAQGWKSHLGPGRHVLGSNLYWYFWNPAGGVAECFSDMDYITDDWVPKYHDTVPGAGSSWFVRAEDRGLRPGHGAWPTMIRS